MVDNRSVRWGRWLMQTWHALQVELYGQYSSTQLQRFEQYQATTSLWRVALVCVCTPLPMLAVIIAMGLLPLEHAERGAFDSPHVWMRQWLTMILMSLCVLQQLRQHLPEFKINVLDCVLISLLSSTCDVGSAIALAAVIGYPLPFTVIVGSLPWYTVFIVIFVIRKRQIIRTTPGSLPKMGRYIVMSLCQLAMTMIYPVYSHVYDHLSSVEQTAFVMLLPFIKLLTKNWICHSLPDSDDAKPEAVVFNVEVFHSLFVSLCMGTTTSTRTVAVLMVMDVVEAFVSFHDVLHILNKLKPVVSKLSAPKDVQVNRYPSIAILANGFIGDGARQPIKASRAKLISPWWMRLTSKKLSVLDVRYVHLSAKVLHKTRIVPVIANQMGTTTTMTASEARPVEHVMMPTDVDPAMGPRQALLSSARASLAPIECNFLVNQTEKLLFVTEFIVLIEYTEVMMPVVYNILVWAFYTLPNRDFYTFLEGICTRAALLSILSNVQLYATLEMLSLLVMAVVMWRRIGLSVVHQLAFVLEDRAANIQSKLLLWVVYIMQNAIVQLGCDYSFQFKWLNQDPGAAPYVFTKPCANATTTR